MTKPMGKYLYSDQTLAKADIYLADLRSGKKRAGAYLRQCTGTIPNNAHELITLLMNTRKPQFFSESQSRIDGTDWTIEECSILGDVSFNTTDTVAFNNGGHGPFTDHPTPLPVNFLFVASALMRNEHGNQSPEMKELLLPDGNLNEEAYFELYERRLLPGLMLQNKVAKQDGVKLVINIPGLGLGQFAGAHGHKLSPALPRVLKRLFTKHAALLDQIHTVNFDPYGRCAIDEFTCKVPNGPILQQRPLQGLPIGARGQVASQLEFPKDGTNYQQGFRLLKVVAWDHFSFPGNDIWADSRSTDDGVSFASSNVIQAMFAMGQFGGSCTIPEGAYYPRQGIFYINSMNHSEIASRFSHLIWANMIQLISFNPKRIEELSQHREDIAKQLLTKLDELGAYAVKLKLASKITDDLASNKADFLTGLSELMRATVTKLTTTDDLSPKDWSCLKTQMDELVSDVAKMHLGTHRAPVQRWLKEFVALFATLFVGSIGITLYNYYNAPKDSFSFNDVGFFKETTSLKKINDLRNTCDKLAAKGQLIEDMLANEETHHSPL